MTEKTLFIELFQPFAQYRNPFTFYYAQTFPLPPKSTIIGLLQNACNDWYGNKFGMENWWNLKISIHGGFESIFWNYQSLIKGELGITENGLWINKHDKNPGGNIWLPIYGEGLSSQRSPVSQQELFNGHLFIFIKAIGDKQIELLGEIKDVLERPRKILYLGRSEDIVFIKNKNIKEVQGDEIEQIKGLEGDIKLTYPTYIKLKAKKNEDVKEFPIKTKKYPVYSIPTKVLFKNEGIPVEHKSEISKQTEREVEFKSVIYTGYDYSIILEENKLIDVEFFKVDDKKEIRIINPYGWL